MSVRYQKLNKIEDPLVFLNVKHPIMNGEIVSIKTPNGELRNGKVLKMNKDLACIQIFQGTEGLDLTNTEITFLDDLFRIGISKDMRGKVFDGQGRLKVESNNEYTTEIIPEVIRGINGFPINPTRREYPRDIIFSGISVIDGLNTLVRGQKLPIFSGQGMSHNKLAAQIVTQGKVTTGEDFLTIFIGIGILQDDAIFFRKKFEESGKFQNVISFINQATDPTIERILIPRVGLTVAEYFAFDLDMHVLVVMNDMTNYCEALREISAAKVEIPGRKGFPGYLYSDLASLYERAGRIKGREGSITQIPILSMPNDDISHPIPDLTGYITEGQIVLTRELHRKGIYPPVDILSSVSRLMKDSIGKENTREDHPDVVSQLFEFYSKSKELKELESIIGEESMTSIDRKKLKFSKDFEEYFINQSFKEDRSIEQTLDIAWALLSKIPKNHILRINKDEINKYYNKNLNVEELTRKGID
ncbi:MAG: V-type ATP synthase subunit B [Candidatus Lokiarchaeota archaeon]|nr:V-type ATP synthase subunit B [Candidatus Lokiarchaeota archaeon]